jgi:small multidrug resistance pump
MPPDSSPGIAEPRPGILHRKRPMTKSWLLLTAAILLEVAGTTSMKFSAGFTKLLPSILIFIFYAASFAVLTLALRKIDISIAYAIWSGMGTVLITAIGILWFREPATAFKLACIGLIVLGVIGLNSGKTGS